MSQNTAINPLAQVIDSQGRVTVNSETANEQDRAMLNAQLANNRIQMEQYLLQSQMAGAFIPLEVPSFLLGG